MTRIIKEMQGGVALKWHVVILPPEEYEEITRRVANYLSTVGRSYDSLYKKYTNDGYMPLLFRDQINFVFNEYEVTSDVVGIISKSTAEELGYTLEPSTNDNTSEP